ncbi:MAG: LysR family transcriptional regulator [Defluviicoccus sp.]|nr:LysR family transcriptional regulator [Defluviicoccus sp.]
MLAVFMTVVECGGFAAAQVALNVGQSTVSRQIGDLERRLGMRLCQRGRAGFRLTDKGRIVYEACQHLAIALESFRTTVGALRGELVGDLSIAVIDNWATERGYPLADVLRTFRSKARQVHIHFHTMAPDEIERAVLGNRVNLGIGVFHQHRPGLSYEALFDDPVELYCGRGHALFERAPHDLDRNDLHATDLAHRAYLSERQVAPLTGNLPSTAAARQIEGVAFLVLSGWHIGYLPVAYAERWVESGRMRSILPETYRLNTEIELVIRRGVTLTLVSQTFADILRETTQPSRG